MSNNNNNNNQCNNIGCNNKADYKLTTLDHRFVYTCLKHHDATLNDNKDNIFNIMVIE